MTEGDAAASSNPFRQSRYYQFLLPLTFFGLLAYAVWSIGMGLMRLGEAGVRTESPDLLRPRVAAAPVGQASSAVSEDTPAVSILPAETETEPLGGSVIVAPIEVHSSVASRAVKEWRLRGTVFDLTTLKPLSGAELQLTDEETNRTIRTRSDARGHYRILVPALAATGYRVTLLKTGYGANYLESGSIGARSMGSSQRQEMAKDLGSRLTASPSSLHAVGAAPLTTDFFLAPRP